MSAIVYRNFTLQHVAEGSGKGCMLKNQTRTMMA
jgi:hypothetical protein